MTNEEKVEQIADNAIKEYRETVKKYGNTINPEHEKNMVIAFLKIHLKSAYDRIDFMDGHIKEYRDYIVKL